MAYRLSINRSHWIDRAARFGHIATGLVYTTVGVVAFIAAADVRTHPADAQGALQLVFRAGVGFGVLVAIAAGLTADFVWQIVRAVTNADLAAANLKGFAERAGWMLSGCIHLGLAVSTLKFAFGVPDDTAEHRAKAYTSFVMSLPMGTVAATAAGVVIIVVGLQLLYRSWVADVDRWLDLGSFSNASRAVIIALGRLGLVARGLLFCAGGVLLALAAIEGDPWNARGLAGTLAAVYEGPLGPVVLALVATGLIGFGIVEFLNARYRRIHVPETDVVAS
jgi:hypothetical protein